VTPLRVVAAAIVEPRGLLLVSKRAAPGMYYLPGGKPEPGESPLACLRRELHEELGVRIADVQAFGELRAPAALEGVEMHMSVFLARLTGTPTIGGEIASMVWWPDGGDVLLAPAVRRDVIPGLREAGLLAVG
jgi:8-oxo-dGTP diphosphatase